MVKRQKPTKKKKTNMGKSNKASREWVGGRFRLPFWITEGEPYRPDIALWLDVTSGLLLEHRVVHPDEAEECVFDSLKRAMENASLAPKKIRVEDPILATKLRAEVGPKVKVHVGPVPEVEDLLDTMADAIEPDGPDVSYLDEGRTSEEAVGRFFESAAELYRIVPWKIVNAVEVMALDAPELDVEGACMSLMGQLGESTGFLVFDSIEDYADYIGFAAFAIEEEDVVGPPPVAVFSVNFGGSSEVPDSMRAEIKKYGWEVAGPKAFPFIVAFDDDGIPRPLSEKDVRFATACCQALARFLGKHSGALENPSPVPVTELMHLELPESASVRITLPHPEFEDVDEILDLEGDLDPEFALALGAAVEIVMEFIEARRREGEEEEWLEWSTAVLQTLCAFKCQEADRREKPWSVKLVKEYLLDCVPRLSLGEEEQLMVLVVAGDFFAWLSTEKDLSRGTADAIGRLLLRERDAVLKKKEGSASSATRKGGQRKK